MLVIAALVLGAIQIEDEPPLGALGANACSAQAPASIETLVDAWVKELDIVSTYFIIGGRPGVLPSVFERCDNPEVAAEASAEQFNACSRFGALRDRAEALARSPVQDGGARRLVSMTGRRFDDAMVLFEHPGDFQIQCTALGAPDRDDRRAGLRYELRVGRHADALAQPTRSVREFATLALSDDREKNIEVLQIDAAAGLAFGARSRRWGGLVYTAIDRTESDKADAEEDNLFTLGVRATAVRDRSHVGQADGRPRHDDRFALDLAYMTDDETRAEGYRGQLEFSPGLDWTGYRFYETLPINGALQFAWTLDLAILDYLEIEEAGEAFALTDDDFARYGGDLKLFIRPVANWSIGTPQFSLEYGLREPFDDSGPHLSMFRAALSLAPSKSSPFSLGLAYTDGEAFDSLKAEEQWTINLGVRY